MARVPPYSEFALVQGAASGGLLSSGLLDMLSAVPTWSMNAWVLRQARMVLKVDADFSRLDRRRIWRHSKPVYSVTDGTGVDLKKIPMLATLRLD